MRHLQDKWCIGAATVPVGAAAKFHDRAQMKISRDMGRKKGSIKATEKSSTAKPGMSKPAAPKRKRATVGRPRKGDGSVIAADR
jgi:hypothetical protein